MVHQLAVHTVGGVISPGEVIMLVVPVADDLTVEARIAPQDIDQLSLGQDVTLKLSAFNQRVTQELNGSVSEISADLSVDERSGAAFYTVRVSLPRTELKILKGLTLAPGMPVEAFFSTGSRTMLSYLVKPLADQIQRAFWEE